MSFCFQTTNYSAEVESPSTAGAAVVSTGATGASSTAEVVSAASVFTASSVPFFSSEQEANDNVPATNNNANNFLIVIKLLF